MLLFVILTVQLCAAVEIKLKFASAEPLEGTLEDTWFVSTGDNKLVPWHTVSYKRRGALHDLTSVLPGCPLEPDPSVEYYCIDGNDSKICGDSEPHGAVVRPRCRDQNYATTAPFEEMRCTNGQWNYIAKCTPAPPPTPPPAPPPTPPPTSALPLRDTSTQEVTPLGCQLELDPSVDYTCVEDNVVRICDGSEPHGVVVHPQCRAPSYTTTVPLDEMRCTDGQWNYIAKCSPAPPPTPPPTPPPAPPPTSALPLRDTSTQEVTPLGCQLELDPSVDYTCVEDNVIRTCDGSEPHGVVVHPQCRAPSYTTTTPLDEMRCTDGQWNYIAKCSPVPTPALTQLRAIPDVEAEPGCPLEAELSVEYVCVDGNTTRPCGDFEPHGTTVLPRCRDQNYTSTAPLDKMRCTDGQWNYIAKCAPVCGRENLGPSKVDTWFVDEEKHGVVPWHIVIYKLTNITVTNETSNVLVSLLPDLPNGTDSGEVMVPVCGGSLISSNVILSSQACFVLEAWAHPDLFTAAAGKLNRAWLVPEGSELRGEFYAQLSPVQSIHVHPKPESDIAVVITEKPFSFDKYIRPICLNFEEDFDNNLIKLEAQCRMVDWDFSQQRTIINLISLGQKCEESFLLQKHLNKDLICALFPVGLGGCLDDSGGSGLAFRDSENTYYLGGVATVGPNPDFTCNTTEYFYFTHVRLYEKFIKQYTNEPLSGRCVLPPFPDHGTYNVYVSNGTHARNIPDAGPGRSLEQVTLDITCAPDHGLTGPSSISCLNGAWSANFPQQCVRMCRLDPHYSVEYLCIVSGTVRGTRACNLYEPPGTVVSPRCRAPIYYSSTTVAFMRCVNGHWNYVAICTPECGRVTPSGATLVVGGLPAKKGELPWHAGIYTKTTTPYKQICGGSLISNSVVISAAHCFWTDLEMQLPASTFAVAVGKLYRPWNNNVDEAQKSDVAEIHLPPRFQGAGANFQEDIAVVIVDSPFEYKTFVRPVCLSFDLNFERLQLQPFNSGKVAGWGLTAADGSASALLRVVEMPYVDIGTCLANSPPDFRAYITSDKICAGTLDSNVSLCRGDSGGGLAFSELDKGLERYYLRGVVSAAPRDDAACNTRAYATFTQIYPHEPFIKQFLDL